MLVVQLVRVPDRQVRAPFWRQSFSGAYDSDKITPYSQMNGKTRSFLDTKSKVQVNQRAR
jgi:hypothetical protein